MPSRRRTQPSRVVAIFWIVAVFVAGTFTASLGSRAAHAEEPTASEPGPDPTPPPTDGGCSGYGAAGELPTGTHSISGVVTAGGSPRADITVFITEASGGLVDTLTNPAGQYAFTGLGDGSYKISFFDPTSVYRSGYYAGPATPPVLSGDAAQVIPIAGSSATNINASLDPESLHVISGSVDDQTGTPVLEAELRADGAYFPLLACASNTTGTFAMEDVRTGIYRILVEAPGFTRGYYRSGVPGNFTTHIAEATLVTVDGDVSGIDIDFPLVYSLTGSVLDGATGIEGFSISASEIVPGASGYASSEPGGAFTIEGLPAGDYHIQYSDGNGVYRSGWYAGNGAISSTEAGAATVTVPSPSIELLAALAPTVSGTITAEGGGVVPGLGFNACDALYEQCGTVSPITEFGEYTARFPMPGTYYIQVYTDGTYPQGGYITPGDGEVSPNLADALVLVVGESGNETGVDGIVPDGGSISVQLTSDGTPVLYPYLLFCLSEDACGDGPVGYPDEFTAASAVYFEGITYYLKEDIDYDGNGRWLVDGGIASDNFDDATAVTVVAGTTITITSEVPPSGTPTDDGGEGVVAPVEVNLADGTGNSVTLTFPDVTGSGTTSLTTSEVGDPVPSGFQLGVPATYYDISTTATYTTPIVICFSYAGVTYVDEANLKLFHFDGSWVDITVPPVDTVNDVICGSTNSLSPFVLAEQTYQFTGFHGPKLPPKINEVKAGDTVGLQFGLGGDLGLSVFATGSPSVREFNCTTGEFAATAQDAVGTLKFKKGVYTYSWTTAKAWKNTCREITLTFKDGTIATLWYRFKP